MTNWRWCFLGSIAPGKLADVILVDGNPAVRIRDICKVDLAIKDGKLSRPADLDLAIGVRNPFSARSSRGLCLQRL